MFAVGVAVAACGGAQESIQNAAAPAAAADQAPQSSGVTAGTVGSELATIEVQESEPEAIPESVSYSTEILPILERSCASCHEPGQAGSDGLALSFASDAAENAEVIKLVTTAAVMPPWPASHLSPTISWMINRCRKMKRLRRLRIGMNKVAS